MYSLKPNGLEFDLNLTWASHLVSLSLGFLIYKIKI